MFVDSHAHLDSPDFQSDLGDVLKRSREAEVASIMTIGCLSGDADGAESFQKNLEEHEGLFGCVGVHPHDASCYCESVERRMLRLLSDPRILGIGEIGLDFHYDYSPRETQVEVFRRQLGLARESGSPVVIHCREAEEMTCRILEEEAGDRGALTGVLHSFTGEWETAERCLSLGFYVSFSGIVTFAKAESLREVAARVPADRLLIETDSPYLAPVPLRGRRNEPAFVVRVAEVLARTRSVSLEQIAATTTANFSALFRPERGI